jgi:predicted ATPase
VLNKLTITNFKCFTKMAIPFNNLTVLAGINGSGKSTIIQSLLLLRQSYLQRYSFEEGLSLNGDLVEIGIARDALNENADSDEIHFAIDWDEEHYFKWRFQTNDKLDYLPIVALKEQHSPEANSKVYEMPLFGEGFKYLKAERLGPRAILPKDDYHVRKFRDVGTSGQLTGHLLDLYGDETLPNDSRIYSKGSIGTLYKQTEAWLNEISPNTRIRIEKHSGTDFVSLQYAAEGKAGISNYYRATNVGFGVSYILPIIVTTLIAKPGDLIIIDTPEAHLHPRGQSIMGELLARTANAGVQVIVETHSDHILNGIRLAVHNKIIPHDKTQFHYISRVVLDKEYVPKLESPLVDQYGRFDAWPKGFFDEWNINLLKLLSPGEK